MEKKNNVGLAVPGARKVVLSFIKALNEEDFNKARTYVNDNMTFEGVLGSRNGAAAYFKDMQNMKLKYEIKKVLSDEKDVCLLYDLHMSGLVMFSCGWYQVEDGKITSLRVVFDPRPVFEQVEKE